MLGLQEIQSCHYRGSAGERTRAATLTCHLGVSHLCQGRVQKVTTYTYDNNGNLTVTDDDGMVTTYTWDGENRMRVAQVCAKYGTGVDRAMIRKAIGVCGLLFCLSAASANDSPLGIYGGAVQLLKGETDIRMVSAAISADVYYEETRVRCEYLLQNDGAEQSVKLGFPDFVQYQGADAPHLREFRSWADGQALDVTVYNPSSEEWGNAERSERWYVRSLRFAPGQRRTILNTYVQPNGGIGSLDSTSRWFRYATWPAAGWKGPIDQITITVHWREPQLWSWRIGLGEKSPCRRARTEVLDGGRRLVWQTSRLEPSRTHPLGVVEVAFLPGWLGAILDGEEVGWGVPSGDPSSLAPEFFLVYGDLTMAPVRRMARMLGLECDWWDGNVVLRDQVGRTFSCSVGSLDARSCGQPIRLRRKPTLMAGLVPASEDSVMYGPVRPICEAFGVQCSLDYEQQKVVLSRASH